MKEEEECKESEEFNQFSIHSHVQNTSGVTLSRTSESNEDRFIRA